VVVVVVEKEYRRCPRCLEKEEEKKEEIGKPVVRID